MSEYLRIWSTSIQKDSHVMQESGASKTGLGCLGLCVLEHIYQGGRF